MTGAGAPGAAGIIHCLQQDKRINLVVADSNNEAIGKHLAKDFIQIPRGDDPAFPERILEISKQKNIQLILPLITKELVAFSKNKDHFKANGISILLSNEEAVAISNNKVKSYEFLNSKGVSVPRFFIAETLEEFIHAAFDLGHPARPFCFKPAVSNGSRGFRIVWDSIDESQQLFNEKPYNTWITYAHALKILSSKPFPQLLVSEYLPGDEYSVDCLADHGKPVLIVPRLRKKMINGITVEGTFINNPALIEYCNKIIRFIGLHGNIGIQLRFSENNEPLLLEINPRVQGTIVAGLGAGINLPLLAVWQELNMPIPKEALQVAWGTKFSRYWTEVFYR
jgi:carbamoyl-phosphate synthase large subunit